MTAGVAGLGVAGTGNPVVSQSAAAAAAAAVAAAATSQANYLSGSSNGQHAAAAAAAALNNPSAALLPGNQVGDPPLLLFQSPAKGATIPYRPSPSNTPTCICNSSSSSNSSNNSTPTAVTSTVAAVAQPVAVAAEQQQQQQQYYKQQQQQQQPLFLQMPNSAVTTGGFSPAALMVATSNNNIPSLAPCPQAAGSPEDLKSSTAFVDTLTAAQQQQALLYFPTAANPLPQCHAGLDAASSYFYTHPGLDPFQTTQFLPSIDLKATESVALASPSSTSSSSCSNYSMMMVPQQPQPHLAPQPHQLTSGFYNCGPASATAEVRLASGLDQGHCSRYEMGRGGRFCNLDG